METKNCGRWALYGSSEVAGVSATGGPVAGVLVAGGSVLALSTVMEVTPTGVTESAIVRIFLILSALLCSVNNAELKTATWLLYILSATSLTLAHNAQHSTSI